MTLITIIFYSLQINLTMIEMPHPFIKIIKDGFAILTADFINLCFDE